MKRLKKNRTVERPGFDGPKRKYTFRNRKWAAVKKRKPSTNIIARALKQAIEMRMKPDMVSRETMNHEVAQAEARAEIRLAEFKQSIKDDKFIKPVLDFANTIDPLMPDHVCLVGGHTRLEQLIMTGCNVYGLRKFAKAMNEKLK